MLPAFGQMINNHYDELVNAINGMQAGDGDLEAALPILKTALQKEFPGKMSEALDYMQSNKLYDFSAEPNKMHAGYTTILMNIPRRSCFTIPRIIVSRTRLSMNSGIITTSI